MNGAPYTQVQPRYEDTAVGTVRLILKSARKGIMTMSQLSAAVVVIAVAIAAIGLGITADDAGADSEPKSRLFVVSSVLAHNTAHGQHKTYFLPFSFFRFHHF